MGVEDLDQLGKIGERTGQPVDLVDHHDIDPARPHLGEQRLQGRAVERGSGQAAVIIVLGHQPPALAGLAADIGLTGFPLAAATAAPDLSSLLSEISKR